MAPATLSFGRHIPKARISNSRRFRVVAEGDPDEFPIFQMEHYFSRSYQPSVSTLHPRPHPLSAFRSPTPAHGKLPCAQAFHPANLSQPL